MTNINQNTPTTIQAKNVLSLVDGLFFEEDIVFPKDALTNNNEAAEIKKPLIKEYPNPIKGILNLEYTQDLTDILQIKIYNVMQNSLIYEGTMSSAIFTLDVSLWQTGFYSIVVKTSEGETIHISSTQIKN